MPPSLYAPATLTTANIFLSGATTLGYLIAALYFLRFGKQYSDRLFFLFAFAFALLGAQRFAMLAWPQADERGQVLLYGPRLIAFLLILGAIIDKNRGAPPSRPGIHGSATNRRQHVSISDRTE